MSGRITELGSVLFAADGSEGTYRNIIKRLDLKPPILVKPNWSGSDVFTEKEILDWTLSAINSEVLVVESYAHFRSPLLAYREGPFDSALEEKLTKQKKKDLRANDKWFGEYSGCTEILEKHNVEYLNLSEELWANRVCDSDVIKEEVNSQFDPIKEEVFYSMVPTRLYELKGGTLLSIAKPKLAFEDVRVSLSIKNLFGMIPTPWRGKFHGKDNALLDQSILNINKVYHSLFEVRGVLESVFSTSDSSDKLLDPMIYRNQPFIWGSNELVELDALVASQLGLDPHGISHLAGFAEQLGPWYHDTVDIGRMNPIEFSP